MAGTELFLMRHPRPDVENGVCYGRTEVPLVAGWEADLAARMGELAGVRSIVTSPSVRCREPAEWLADALAVPVEHDERFMELDFGDWDGLRWEAFDGPEARAWAADFVNRAPPGGESLAALAERVLDGIRAHGDRPGRLIVTHGGPIRTLLARARGLPLAQCFEIEVDFARPYPVETSLLHE